MTVYITNRGQNFLDDRFIACNTKIASLFDEFYQMNYSEPDDNLLSKAEFILVGIHYHPNTDELTEIEKMLGDTSYILIPHNPREIIKFDGISRLDTQVIDTSYYQKISSKLFPNVYGLKEYHPTSTILKFSDEAKNNTITVNVKPNSPNSIMAIWIANKVAESIGATVLALGLRDVSMLSQCPNVLPIATVSSEWIYQLIARSRLLVDFDSAKDDRFKIAGNLLRVPCFTDMRNNIEFMVNQCINKLESNNDDKLAKLHEQAKTLDIATGLDKLRGLL